MAKKETNQIKLHFATDDHVKKLGLLYVPHSQLAVLDNFNDREDYGSAAEMSELAESIYDVGPKVPLKGYKEGDKYIVIVGHRRHRAGDIIKKKYGQDILFPFMPYPPGAKKKDMLLDTLLTNSGKELTPLEKASTVSKLIEENVGTKEIAMSLGGVSEVYVKNLARLWTIPDSAKKLIRDNVISSTLVMGVLKNKNTNLDEWLQEIEKQANSEGSAETGKKARKKKGAQITAKTAPKKGGKGKFDSMKEFKRFRKQNPGTYESKAKQAAYEFFCSVLDGHVAYSKILEFFTGK